MMQEFMSWEFLGTFAGAALATGLLTQLCKGLLDRIPTQLVSYLLALLVLVGTSAVLHTAAGWQDFALIPLNALLVSFGANGAYSGIVRVAQGAGNGE